MNESINDTFNAGMSPNQIAKAINACPTCQGTGGVDTGGQTPWGAWIEDKCPDCNGSGKLPPLWNGSECKVPREIAICPECQGTIAARSMQWDAETGRPDAAGSAQPGVNG